MEENSFSAQFFTCLRKVLTDEMGHVSFERFLGRLPSVDRMALLAEEDEDGYISARHVSVVFAALDLLTDLPEGFERLVGLRCINELCSDPLCAEEGLSFEEIVARVARHMKPFSYEIRKVPQGYMVLVRQRPVYLPAFCRFMEGMFVGIGQEAGFDYVSAVEVECGLTSSGEGSEGCLFEVSLYDEEDEP